MSTKVTPEGSAPVSDNADIGLANDVTANDPAEPTVNVVDAADVIAGASFTVSVNGWLASVPMPFVASNVRWYVPPVPVAGVPERVAVPSPLSTNVTPEGRAPVSLSAGAGTPVVVTTNDCGPPAVKSADAADVTAGASSTVSVNAWWLGSADAVASR